MKLSTIKSLVSYLNGEAVTNLDEIKAELEAEVNKDAKAKAEKAAGYDAAWGAIEGTLAATTEPLTVADIFERAEAELPEGFTKGKVQYGLTHQWAERIVKIEGKPNTYRLA